MLTEPPPGVAVPLRDGSTVSVRPVVPEDRDALRAFLEGLDEEARRLRFFTAAADMGRAADNAVRSEDWLYGLIAVQGEDGRIVGHAEYIVEEERPSAEVAFEIADEMRGMGLATILMAHLAAHAASRGIVEFVAEVLPDNHRMINVFRDSGFPVEVRSAAGVIHVAFPTELTAAGRRRFEQRDRIAASAAVRRVLAPASVAVVGASADPRSVGHGLLANLVRGGFTGEVHAVNRRGGTVEGLPAHRSVADVPGPVELALIAVPAREVVAVARECAAKGARSLVVASAGFGGEGAVEDVQRMELLRVCRAAGMRLVGPNCLGVINTAEDVRLHATFAPVLPEPGAVGFLTQSGGLGIAVLDRLGDWDVGLSSFVSVGDKADLSGNDLLQYWEGDDRTQVIVLYLQSLGNPRRFGRIARRVARRKPVAAVMPAGESTVCADSGSTTGALLAVADVRVDALFRQAGVIRTNTLSELLGVTALLASQPLPAGPRTAIVTNASGVGRVCADACAAAGLQVAPGHPRDVLLGVSAQEFGAAVAEALADTAVDAVIALYVPPVFTEAGDVARALVGAAASRTREIPLLSVFVAGDTRGAPAPVFRFPEDAARALGRAASYASWRAAPEGAVLPVPGVRSDEAAAVLASALAGGGGWLSPADVEHVLECYGIPRLPVTAAEDAVAAGRAAAALRRPVSLKGVAPGLAGRTEAGAIELGLQGWEAVEQAAWAMRGRLAEAGHEDVTFSVQPMAPEGVELLVGVAHDPRLGSVVACGAGGAIGMLLRDVAVRLAPLTDADIDAMLAGLAIRPLLDGFRGAPAADLEAVQDVLARVSAMVDAHPEIAELDLEPVIAAPDGAFIVDARVRVEMAEISRDVPRVR